MKRQYKVRRQTVQRPDASRRWDRAYQNILQWALETDPNSVPGAKNGKEEFHAGSGVHTGLDSRTGEATDY
jgi:hypothetical protein